MTPKALKSRKKAKKRKNPARDLARATFNCVADIHTRLPEIMALHEMLGGHESVNRLHVENNNKLSGKLYAARESLAVQTSHVRRLLGEKEILQKRIADLEASQGSSRPYPNEPPRKWMSVDELLPLASPVDWKFVDTGTYKDWERDDQGAGK